MVCVQINLHKYQNKPKMYIINNEQNLYILNTIFILNNLQTILYKIILVYFLSCNWSYLVNKRSGYTFTCIIDTN